VGRSEQVVPPQRCQPVNLGITDSGYVQCALIFTLICVSTNDNISLSPGTREL